MLQFCTPGCQGATRSTWEDRENGLVIVVNIWQGADHNSVVHYSSCAVAGSLGYGSHFIVAWSFPQQCWQRLRIHYVLIVHSFEQSHRLMQALPQDQINVLQD